MFAILARRLVEHTGVREKSPNADHIFITNLYNKYKAFLFQKAGLYTDSLDGKEDIVQSAVLRLIGKEDRLRAMEPAALMTYMALTVRSAALNYLRDEQRDRLNAVPLLNDEEQEYVQLDGGPCLTLEEQMLVSCRDEEVRAAIARLSERDRAALMGKYFLEMDNQELAELLGVTAGTLRTLLCRARGRAMKELRKEGILHE